MTPVTGSGGARAPEIPAGLECLNVGRPVTLADLRGRPVVLYFWRYGSAACRQTWITLRQLQARLSFPLSVIGVHCPLFPEESRLYGVRQAVMRLDLRDPVVNDPEGLVWRAYAVAAWPAMVLIDPAGRIVGAHGGDFDPSQMAELLERDHVRKSRSIAAGQPVPLALEKHKQPETLLSFPSRLLVDPDGESLYVADVEHHRICIFDLRRLRLRRTYGGPQPGFCDGPRQEARFHFPEGLLLHGGLVYVADSGNRALRAIDPGRERVYTVAGGPMENGPGVPADEPPLLGPLSLAPYEGGVAVADAAARRVLWLHPSSGKLRVLAGSGEDGLHDGPARAARFGQPAGLAEEGEQLWIADSDCSALRRLHGGGAPRIETCIGHGLFVFGSADGDLLTGRMQHPNGLAVAPEGVYLADTYNHLIRRFDPTTGRLSTVAGSGEPGCEDGAASDACFWEPRGLELFGDLLLVADTNNHAIRTVSREDGTVATLELGE